MNTGLRRFAAPAPAPVPVPSSAPQADGVPRCELCAEPIVERHSHVVNLESRAIHCTCRGCWLLFTQDGAGGGKRRAVPERYRWLRSPVLGEALWESAGIPVGMAFLFHNTDQGRTVAFYPSPAGATESLLPLNAWQDLLGDNPELADVAPDVEAVLVNRTGDGPSGVFECFLVPIDACYRLVGLIKLRWRGFDGGQEARAEIAAFFAELRERAGDLR